MSVFFILILILILVLGVGFGVTLWFALKHRQTITGQEPATEAAKKEALSFRWRYISLPLVIFILSIILSLVFYPKLPAEVGYHFQSDGTPDRWFSREMAVVLMLVPQLFLTLVAGAIIWGITKLGILSKQTRLWMEPHKILSLMGNVVALPQIVVGFVILDIFTYNLYQIHIMPTWAFLLTLGIATAVLVALLAFTVIRARKQVTPQSEK